MIILASTSDELQLVTRDAANVDVHVTYADLSSGVVTVGRQNTLISTATTTTILSSPASSTYRTAKYVSIRNRSSSGPSTVRVIHRASGPTDAELAECILSPSTTLEYEEHRQWRILRGPYSFNGRASDRQFVAPTVGVLQSAVLSNDASVANSTANRLADVQSLGFWAMEGHVYWFTFRLMYTSAATTTGSRWAVYGPGSVLALRAMAENSLTTTTKTSIEGTSAYDIPAASSASSAATGSNRAIIEGFIQTSVDGRVYLRFASEVSSSAVTLKRGSVVHWMRTV